jgi:hypothetical protein
MTANRLALVAVRKSMRKPRLDGSIIAITITSQAPRNSSLEPTLDSEVMEEV